MRVLVAEINNQAERYLVIRQVVEIRTPGRSPRPETRWPTHAVYNFTLLGFLRIDLPEFLKANSVVLCGGVFV